MSKTIWISIAVVVVLLAVGWFVMAKNGQTVQAPAPSAAVSATTEPAMSQPPVASESAMPASGSATMVPATGKLTIDGSEFMFSPATITATAGKPITLTFKNTGKYPHNFTIDSLKVATKTIQPGGTDTVTFTPKAGTYDFYCSVDSHATKGMKGTLTVQ